MGTKPFLFRCFAQIGLTLLAEPLSAKTLTMTAADNNTSIWLVEGDTLVITLPSGIPDAYRWEQHPAKPSALTALNDDFTPAKDPKGVATQTFRFNAASVGSAALTLSFKRQTAGAAPEVAQVYSIDVSVSSGEPKAAVLIGTYKGTTACADCTGIQTDLRLYAKGKNDFTGTI